MRVKGSNITRKRHKKILNLAKGYVGSKGKLFRVANEQILHSLTYAYRDRRNRRRDLHRLWIMRINASVRKYSLTYSTFMNLLQKNSILLNRKMLADLCFHHPEVFKKLVTKIK